MRFRIEVEKKKKDEDFTFEGLKYVIFHEDCGGGSTQLKIESSTYLSCRRCGKDYLVERSYAEMKANICKTAIDGEKREINENVYTVQKQEG